MTTRPVHNQQVRLNARPPTFTAATRADSAHTVVMHTVTTGRKFTDVLQTRLAAVPADRPSAPARARQCERAHTDSDIHITLHMHTVTYNAQTTMD